MDPNYLFDLVENLEDPKDPSNLISGSQDVMLGQAISNSSVGQDQNLSITSDYSNVDFGTLEYADNPCQTLVDSGETGNNDNPWMNDQLHGAVFLNPEQLKGVSAFSEGAEEFQISELDDIAAEIEGELYGGQPTAFGGTIPEATDLITNEGSSGENQEPLEEPEAINQGVQPSAFGGVIPDATDDPITNEGSSSENQESLAEETEQAIGSGEGEPSTSTGATTETSKRKSRRKREEPFLHELDNPDDPKVKRARQARENREKTKALVGQLKKENSELKKMLSHSETVKFMEMMAGMIKLASFANPELKKIEIKPTRELESIQCAKLTPEECETIWKNANLGHQKVTLGVSIVTTESTKELKITQNPGGP